MFGSTSQLVIVICIIVSKYFLIVRSKLRRIITPVFYFPLPGIIDTRVLTISATAEPALRVG